MEKNNKPQAAKQQDTHFMSAPQYETSAKQKGFIIFSKKKALFQTRSRFLCSLPYLQRYLEHSFPQRFEQTMGGWICI